MVCTCVVLLLDLSFTYCKDWEMEKRHASSAQLQCLQPFLLSLLLYVFSTDRAVKLQTALSQSGGNFAIKQRDPLAASYLL